MKNNKQINYGEQFINKIDIKYVNKALEQKKISSGPFVIKFEKSLKKIVKSKFVYSCNSGTSAIHLAFLSSGLKKNDTIIIPSINFVAVKNISDMMGIKCYFADIDYETGQVSPTTIIQCIKKNKIKNLKAIVIMFLGGYPRNIKKFFYLKKKYNCLLIEDSCHAFGASYSVGKYKINVGSCQHSDISTFSFHPLKTITTGEGGAITTNNRIISKRIEEFRSHGFIKNKKKRWNYFSKDFGLNYRMSDINAALGFSQLKKLKLFLIKRKKIYDHYIKNLDGFNDVVDIIKKEPKTFPSYHLVIIKIDFNKIRLKKENFLSLLEKKGINCQFHYIPCYKLGKKIRDFEIYSNSEIYEKNAISLPIHFNINNYELNYITKEIKKIITKYIKN